MNLGIIGAGNVGGTLGRLWVEAGHRVLFSFSRNPIKLKALAHEIGEAASFGSPMDAVEFADVILFAPPFEARAQALTMIGNAAGKLIVDTTNPYRFAVAPTGQQSIVRTIPDNASAFETLRKALPTARWGKAFSTLQPSALLRSAERVLADRVAVPFIAPDAASAVLMALMIRDAGGQPIEMPSVQSALAMEIPGPLALSDDLTPAEALRRIALLSHF